MVGFTTKSIDFSDPLKSAGLNLGALVTRASMVNLDTNETYQFLFNPEEVRNPDVKAVYDEANVAFGTQPRLRYKHTTGVDWVFTLYLSSTSSNAQGVLSFLSLSRNLNNDTAFLQSLVYPIESVGIKNRRPPNVRFVWPDLANVKVRVMSVGTHYQKFNFRLQQQITAVDIVLRENPDKQVQSNMVRTRGSNGRPGLIGDLLDKLPSGVSDAVDSVTSFF